MHRLALHTGNAFWLTLVLIGVPAITSIQVGTVGLSAVPEFRMLTLGGLALGAAGNLLAAQLTRGKNRKLWRNWTLAYSAALLLYLLAFAGHLQFQWLKTSLLWLKKHLI